MLEDIKKELLNHPDKLKDVLEHFGYCNIIIREKYMQFGRDEVSSKKSIVIKLKENKFLYVHDYARNIQKDLFSYIMSQRHVEFSDVLNEVKKVIGIKQCTKLIKNNEGKVLYVAKDANAKLISPIIQLAKEKNIEIVEVSTMKELGKIGGIDVNSSAILTLE